MASGRELKTQADIEAKARAIALAQEHQHKETRAAIVPADLGASVLPAETKLVPVAIAAIRRNKALAEVPPRRKGRRR